MSEPITEKLLDEILAAEDFCSLSSDARKYMAYYIQENAIADSKCFTMVQVIIEMLRRRNLQIPNAFVPLDESE